MQIERLTAADWARFRRIRLAALRDAPDAFGSTFTEASGRSEADWRAQLDTLATFVAVVGSEDVGTARGAPDDADPDSAFLLSMWVDPAHRGAGIGDALVLAVCQWARSTGFSRLLLDVADGNLPAVALYARMGFEPTGETGTLPSPRTHITEHRRALDLSRRRIE